MPHWNQKQGRLYACLSQIIIKIPSLLPLPSQLPYRTRHQIPDPPPGFPDAPAYILLLCEFLPQPGSYKQSLVEKNYAVRSVNSMQAGLNGFLEFLGRKELKVKSLRQQKQIYCPAEKELTKAEYLRLLEASVKQEQLNLIIQTICGTGIRVSELKYFTVEGVRRGEITVQCKNKNRTVLVPGKLRKRLQDFAKKNNIREGSIFITITGKTLDLSNIWSQMKKICVD